MQHIIGLLATPFVELIFLPGTKSITCTLSPQQSSLLRVQKQQISWQKSSFLFLLNSYWRPAVEKSIQFTCWLPHSTLCHKIYSIFVNNLFLKCFFQLNTTTWRCTKVGCNWKSPLYMTIIDFFGCQHTYKLCSGVKLCGSARNFDILRINGTHAFL